MMLIGCLEREFLKNGLNSDVNSTLKSDLIVGINFSTIFIYDTSTLIIKCPPGDDKWHYYFCKWFTYDLITFIECRGSRIIKTIILGS